MVQQKATIISLLPWPPPRVAREWCHTNLPSDVRNRCHTLLLALHHIVPKNGANVGAFATMALSITDL